MQDETSPFDRSAELRRSGGQNLSQLLAAFDPDRPALRTSLGAWRFGEMAQAHALAVLRPARAHASVALKFKDPARLVIALAALDGFIDRLTLIAHDAPEADVAGLLQQGETSLVLTDGPTIEGVETLVWTTPIAPLVPGEAAPPSIATQWLVATSGTTGRPKLVSHTLASLTRTAGRSSASAPLRSRMARARSGTPRSIVSSPARM